MIGEMYVLKEKSEREQNISYVSSRLALISMLWIYMLVLQIINWSTSYYLTGSQWLAIEPRNWKSLPFGLLASPFLHANWSHFIGNSFSFLILGFLTLTQRTKFKNAAHTFGKISLLILILGGGCIWILGRNGHHIGASGWIFGLMGYNVAFGLYSTCVLGKPKWIGLLISILMIFFYLTTILSALNPFSMFAEDVSGEGHLSCLMIGILTAIYDTTKESRKKKLKIPVEEIELGIEKFEGMSNKLPYLI